MKNFYKTLKMWLAAVALAMGFSGNANAACCYVPMEIVAAAITASTTAITGAIGASTSTVVGAINYATQSPSSMLIQEIQAAGGKQVAATKTLMEAQAALANAQTEAAHNQTQKIAADTIKVQAINNSRAVAGCSALTAVVGGRMGGAAAASAGGGATNNRKVLDRLTTSELPQKAVAEVIASRKAAYCSELDRKADRCEAAVEPAYQNADISASAFFNGANTDGKVSLTFDDKQKKAAEDFTRNIVAPIPEPRLDKDTEKTPQGQAYLAMHSAMAGKKSVVAKFFTDHLASRDGALLNTPDGRVVVAGARKRATEAGYTPANLPMGGLSYAQVLELEANHRYMGQKWNSQIDSETNEAVLLKNLVQMQALQLHLQYLQMKEMQEMRGVIAVAANELVEMNSAPKLAVQRDAAIKSSQR